MWSKIYAINKMANTKIPPPTSPTPLINPILSAKTFLRNLLSIFFQLPPRLQKKRTAIFHAYLYLCFQRIVLEIIFRQKVRQTSIFGLHINFATLSQYIHQFEANFIQNDYYFETHSRTPLIIDCGANTGDTTSYFRFLYPQSRIICFEPEPLAFSLLSQLVSNNKLTNVTLHQLALSDRRGSKVIYANPNQPASDITSFYPSTDPGRTQIRLAATTKAVQLSRYISTPVDLLKLDIEGAEREVIPQLANANKLKLFRHIIIEYHHHLTPGDDQFSQILKILEDNHFTYQISTPLKFTYQINKFQDIHIHCFQKPI